MKLHEYQAKEMFRRFGIPVPDGDIASSAVEALRLTERITGPPWVVKAQVHAGGRGKGGGVRLVKSPDDARNAAGDILGKPLFTKQTGTEGKVVRTVLVEEGVEIERELYLAITIDRSLAKPVMIFSQSGGMEIEDTAEESPELVLREIIDNSTGWMPFHGRGLVYGLDPLPRPEILKELMSVMSKLYELFLRLDCSLAEINPLVITQKGKVMAIDAKISVDDNALFRQKEMRELDDPSEKDPLELVAGANNLNYIRLDGNIGAMVNGAGLAMATMDVIKLAGAEPANFLDVGGGASEEMITKGFEILLGDEKIEAILINIFGGILRCDVLARGVLEAARRHEIKVPVIVRLEGTNVEEGRKILEESDMKFLVAKDILEAADMVTRQVQEESK